MNSDITAGAQQSVQGIINVCICWRSREMVLHLYHSLFLNLCSFPLLVYQYGLQSGVRCLLGIGFYLHIFLGTGAYPMLVSDTMSHHDISPSLDVYVRVMSHHDISCRNMCIYHVSISYLSVLV